MQVQLILAHRRTCHLHLPKSDHWIKNVLANFDDCRMHQMLRTSKAEFFHILNLISDDPIFQNQRNVPQLPIELQLKIALFRFGGYGDSAAVRQVVTIFGVGDGGTVMHAIIHLKSKYLIWPSVPSVEERKKIVSSTMHELPYCVGYLDGTEVRLFEAPCKNHALLKTRLFKKCYLKVKRGQQMRLMLDTCLFKIDTKMGGKFLPRF